MVVLPVLSVDSDNVRCPWTTVVLIGAMLVVSRSLVIAPAGSRLSDYWRLGPCMLALFFLVSTFVAPIFWVF